MILDDDSWPIEACGRSRSIRSHQKHLLKHILLLLPQRERDIQSLKTYFCLNC